MMPFQMTLTHLLAGIQRRTAKHSFLCRGDQVAILSPAAGGKSDAKGHHTTTCFPQRDMCLCLLFEWVLH